MKLSIILIISSIYFFGSVNSKSKYYDGPDRAYKFGYSIEGNQHRHEQKDENGIIMGEFGFITADGVYHVTGYGTDENGNFKILYMKNIKIGLPGEPGQQPAPKNIGESPQQLQPATITAPTPQTPAPVINEVQPKYPKPSDITSCGSCIIPELEKGVNDVVQQKVTSSANSIAQAPRTNNGQSSSGRTSGQQGGLGVFSGGQSNVAAGRQGKALDLGNSSNNLNGPNINAKTLSSQNGSPLSSSPLQSPSHTGSSLSSGSKSSSQFGKPSSGSNSPSSDRNSPSSSSNSPSSSVGLSVANGSPSGISGSGSPSKIPLDLSRMQEIINGILYKFNYTVGYHGHHETGDHIGNKDGGYFSVGRDGYRRTVDYTANENGFQPNIKLRPANENEIPKPETEKEAGLKGYEFKWFNLGENKKH